MSEPWHDINLPVNPFLREKAAKEETARKQAEQEQDKANEAAEVEAAKAKIQPGLSEPKWTHADVTRAKESAESVVIGDKIMLSVTSKDIPAGAAIYCYVHDFSVKAHWNTERQFRTNVGKDNTVKVEWVVDKNKNDGEKPDLTFWFVDKDEKKPARSAEAKIPLIGSTNIDFIEFPDILFNQGSAIALLDENGVLIGALCAVFAYTKEHGTTQALACGHATEADGSIHSALEVSKLRAEGIKALLAGNNDTWIDVVNDFSITKDIQQFLATLALSYGWNCTPGKVDGALGPASKAAIRKYKAEYNKKYNGKLADTDTPDCEMFSSVFAVLRAIVLDAYKAATKETSLPAIAWANDGKGFYGCGTFFPPEKVKSKSGQRVELFFIPPDAKPAFTEHKDSKTPVTTGECPVYGKLFKRNPIEYKVAGSNILKIKDIDGPKHLAHTEKAVYSVKSFNRDATEEEKKSLGWVIMLNGKEVERHEKLGEKFEFTAIGQYAGDTISVHPFLHSPSESLCVKTTVGECLLFDGKNLVWVDEELKEKKRWLAVSGDSAHTDAAKDGGPIPAGKWVALQSTRQHTPDGDWWKKFTHDKELKEFGSDRIGLLPFMKTETHGRKDFFIHGGTEAGSGHGIDLTDKMKGFLDEFLKNGKDLVVVVKGAELKVQENADLSNITVTYSGSIPHIPDKALKTLKLMLKEANVTSAIITSTVRTPADQARIMYDNIATYGVSQQKTLYGTSGDQVIDEYSRLKGLGKSVQEIKSGMENKINEVGSTSVSKHCCNPTTHSIFDVAPSSIPTLHKKDFVEAIKKANERGDISKYFLPPTDPAYHIEVVL